MRGMCRKIRIFLPVRAKTAAASLGQRAVALAPADASLVPAVLMSAAPQRTHQPAIGQAMGVGPGHSGSCPLAIAGPRAHAAVVGRVKSTGGEGDRSTQRPSGCGRRCGARRKGWLVEKVCEQVADPCCGRRPDRHYGRKDERAKQRGTHKVPDTLRGRSWRCRWRFAAASCTSPTTSSQPLADHPARTEMSAWRQYAAPAA